MDEDGFFEAHHADHMQVRSFRKEVFFRHIAKHSVAKSDDMFA